MGDRREAERLYREFREAKPDKLLQFEIEIPKTVIVIGHTERIWYRTTHGRKLTLYDHPFHKGSRPLLCAAPDGEQLFLLGGRYRFTERGIVDLGPNGEELENPRHGRAINPRRPAKPTQSTVRPAGQHAYRGYLVTPNLTRDVWYVAKDGFNITSAGSADSAHREIDKLLA